MSQVNVETTRRAWNLWSRGDVDGLLSHFGAHGKTSGLELGDEMGERGASVFQLCDGNVIRLVQFRDRDRAFSDLGLED